MTTIAIRVPDEVLAEASKKAKALHVPRSEYIRQAIIAMNQKVETELRRKRIMEASKLVRKESMKVNAEFAAVEDLPDA
jgi:predicted transcriptional regulator